MLAEIFSETGFILLALLLLILFGANKLPKFARSLGSAQKEYKAGLAESRSENSQDQDS